jgi:hypothetical protein
MFSLTNQLPVCVLAKNATAKSKKENEVEMGFQLNK